MNINKRIAILLSTVFAISLVGTSGAIKVKAETNGSSSTVIASGTPQTASGTPSNGIEPNKNIDFTWTSMKGLSNNYYIFYDSFAYGNGKFVAVGNGTPYYSTDGQNWIEETGKDLPYESCGIIYGNGRFICIGVEGTTMTYPDGTSTISGSSYYSIDGVNWSRMTGIEKYKDENTGVEFNGISSVAYGNGRFVCVGDSGAYYSVNGETWTKMTGLSSNCGLVAYGDGRFVCTGNSGTSYYSVDGQTWTPMTGLYTNNENSKYEPALYGGLAYGNGKFVTVNTYGDTYYSTDGQKWTKMEELDLGDLYSGYKGITYGNGVFVIVGCKNYYSTNGLTWTEMPKLDVNDTLTSINYLNDRFVATGISGQCYYFIYPSYVSEISLDNTTLTMNKGETKNLSVSYTPSNAVLGKNCTFSSSNENVAKVDANGQVVAVTPGTATITATTEKGLTATCKVTVNAPLAIKDYKVSLQSPQTVGTTLTLTTSAEGQGTLSYRFAVYRGSTLIKVRDYNTTNYTTWTPTEAGTYTLYFKVKDSTGKELVKSMNYVVNKVIKIDSFGVDLASPQTIGTTLKLTTTAEGQGILNYRFVVYKGSTLIKVRDFNTTNYTTWTPTEAGAYTLYFKVKDETGREVVKSINYVVNKVIKINSYGVNLASPQAVGKTLTLTTVAEGQGVLNYRFVVYKGTTLIKVRDYSTTSYTTWAPTTAGTYTLYFKVKDETGREVVKSMQYVVI